MTADGGRNLFVPIAAKWLTSRTLQRRQSGLKTGCVMGRGFRTEDVVSGIDEPELSGTPFRYLLFHRNARSGTDCQITRNVFCLPFRHLFTMGGDDGYEFMTPRCFSYLQPVEEF